MQTLATTMITFYSQNELESKIKALPITILLWMKRKKTLQEYKACCYKALYPSTLYYEI